MPRSRTFILALLVVAPACDRGSSAAPAPVQPAPIAAVPDDPVPAQPPQRVIAANTAAADYLRILLPARRVAAIPEQVTEFSFLDFQSEGWETVTRFAHYSAEPVLSAHPDFVITHAWQEADTTQVLKAEKVPLIVIASAKNWDDIALTFKRLGRVLHCEKQAEKEILRRGNVVARLARDAQKRKPISALLYSNDGNAGWTAGAHTTVDTMFRMIGVKNAAASLEEHAQLDFERLVSLDPDVLVLAAPPQGQTRTATLDVLEKTPVLAKLRAVEKKSYVWLDGKFISSDSPTLVDGADTLALAIDDLLAGRR